MSWSIAEITNTVEITPKVAKELFKLVKGGKVEELWYSEDEVAYEGHLNFNIDHMEHMGHMDYVWQKEVQAVLRKNKVKGDICFGSLEGDNAETFWGYRFDGKGGMVELNGEIKWEEA